jgi:hypothetical protein
MSHPSDRKLTKTSVAGKDFFSFPYEEIGIQGVGRRRRPIVNMDEFIDHSRDEELHIESCKGLALVESFTMGTFIGDIPPFEKENIGKECWSEMLMHLEQHDPTGIHRKAIGELLDTTGRGISGMKAVYKYMYFAMNALMPWFFTVYLKKSSFQDKTLGTDWLPAAAHFPKIKEYVESLPFAQIGRVLFFTTAPGMPVPAHRDHPMAEHKDHNINLFFSSGSRKSFVWNEQKNEKRYLSQDCRSYFFNNRDYHGVDKDANFRYTLRVDGTFTQEVQSQLELEDGYTFKWSYTE